MTTVGYSPAWRALALEFCAARDAALNSPPTGGRDLPLPVEGPALTPGVVGQAPEADASPRDPSGATSLPGLQGAGLAGGAGVASCEVVATPAKTVNPSPTSDRASA